MTAQDSIAEVLQKGYGDATLTPLDLEVADNIKRRLLQEGWASPDSVRAIVAAAGGRVEVGRDLLVHPPEILTVVEDVQRFSIILTTQHEGHPDV